MKIKNCKIKKETIVYEVLTSGNQPFTYDFTKQKTPTSVDVEWW